MWQSMAINALRWMLFHPMMVRAMLEAAITKRIDMEKWDQTKRIEKEEQEQLEKFLDKLRVE